jgi:protein phosphatase
VSVRTRVAQARGAVSAWAAHAWPAFAMTTPFAALPRRPVGAAAARALPARTAEDSAALRFALGYTSAIGRCERNEDFVGAVSPELDELTAKGVLAAVADGVSGSGGGREAAEHAVRSLLSDYYATPSTWSVPASLERVIAAVNRWLVSRAGAGAPPGSMATTLSALVLRGDRYFVAHVGDSRVYRLRGNECTQLTEDHVWDRPDMQHVLRRAVGLDARLAVDYLDGELRAGDRFVLCTDGVWEPLEPRTIRRMVAEHGDAQAAARALVDEALARGGRGNATALVLRVEQVAPYAGRDPGHRVQTAEELRSAVERGDAQALSAPPSTPLLQHPVGGWQVAALLLAALDLLLLYLLLAR